MSDEQFVTPPEGPAPEPPSPPEPAYPAGDGAGDSAPAHPDPSRTPPPQWHPGSTPAAQRASGWTPPAQPGPAWTPPGQGAPGPGWIAPPQGQPGGTPSSGAGSGGMPTWGKVLIIVGAVLLVLVILMAWGCYSCARGCQEAVETIQEGSYTISHDGETRWLWRGEPQPRDTAPPDAAKDAQTLAGGERIKKAIEAYKTRTGSYPALDDLGVDASQAAAPSATLRDVLASDVVPWPTNPWTGGPMAEEPHRGDFIYVLWNDGTYTLRVFTSSGETDL